jgi:hypothetical protein
MVYHNTPLESNSESKFYFLRQKNTLKMTEDDKDRSWEYTKVLKYSEVKSGDGNTSYKL